ncbi:hypothetical protein L484_022456 [Morus notabilis]|uniref:Growth-regulating factor n=1 Tax=Morus notabilis TaxID=981085 RepID=W9RE94_9ROSA|nr:hypothetical protein L484_022456 [Morus notabilis]
MRVCVCCEGGRGLGKKEWTAVMHGEKISKLKEESCPLIKPVFTITQLQEFQQQTLIHRHIAAGLPVPLHLVIPIWESVAYSLGTSDFVRGFSSQGFDYRHMMEPEPMRCRRTDGKKWRCSKKVVAGEKYCERHMHRGRQRSRKLVEASSGIASPSNPTTTRPEKSKTESVQNPSSNLLGLQLMTPSTDVTNVSHGGTTITSNLSKKRVTYVTSPYIATNITRGSGVITSVMATNNSNPVLSSTKSNQNVGNHMNEMYFGNTSTIKGSSNNNKNISVGRTMSPGLGFSPKSVLQVVRRNDLCIDKRNGTELELGRCRRTDGKKWRCRRDVIPDQKYCACHMHRGAKKLAKPFEPTASSAVTNTAPLPPATATSCRTDRTSPNTNLSISIPVSPYPISNDEKSDSGNSSDTTISDTSISAYAISKVPS